MHSLRRPDGTEDVATSSVTYLAVGWVPPEGRAAVVDLLDGLVTAWRAGSPPEQAALALAEPVRSAAIRAASRIRQFESLIGVPSAPVVEQGVRTQDHADNIGIFAQRTYRCAAAADLGDQAAMALADLLQALGAVDVLGTNID